LLNIKKRGKKGKEKRGGMDAKGEGGGRKR